MQSARIIEIFSSIQGEGLYVGQPHLFVRFWDCNLACRYCDTDYKGPYRQQTGEAILEQIRRQLRGNGAFHAISLTGGEPLLWQQFLEQWLPELKRLPPQIYLETNGTLPKALEAVLPWIDIVAMDLKLPSTTRDRAVWKEHEAFLKIAFESGRDLFLKVVVTADTSQEELDRAAALVRRVSRKIPVVLQPVTPWGPVKQGVEESQINRWRKVLHQQLDDVRVIPQIHRILGVP